MMFVINVAYFIAAVLFIVGLKQMSHPASARRGIVWAGVGMLLATVVTFFHPEIKHNYFWIILAMLVSSVLAWWSGKKVAMTDMPQMIVDCLILLNRHGLPDGQFACLLETPAL